MIIFVPNIMTLEAKKCFFKITIIASFSPKIFGPDWRVVVQKLKRVTDRE